MVNAVIAPAGPVPARAAFYAPSVNTPRHACSKRHRGDRIPIHRRPETELAEAVRRRIPGTEVEIVNFDWNGRPSIEGQVAPVWPSDFTPASDRPGIP